MDSIQDIIKLCGFKRPFNPKGKPTRYVGFLIPFLYKERVKREECLRAVGINPDQVGRGHYCRYFANYQNAEILSYHKTRRYWEKGKNFDTYFSYVIQQMLRHDRLRVKAANMLVNYGKNSLNYILKSEEE